MTTAIVDTSVLIHLYRNHPAAKSWFNSQTTPLSLTSITWLEFIDGAPSKAGMGLCLTLLKKFDLIRFTEIDQDWAMQQLLTRRLSQGVHTNDCLIASVCHRLQVPIYTNNVKDLQKLLPTTQVIKPFTT